MSLVHRESGGINDRVPPQSVDLEMCVLGGVMLEPAEAYPLAAEYLTRDSFYLEGHGLLFTIMGELMARGIPPDMNAVLDELRSRNLLDKVGGSGVVMGMLNSVPTAANVEFHALKLREKSQARLAIRSMSNAIEALYRCEDAPDGIIEDTQQQLSALNALSTREQSVIRPFNEFTRTAFDRIYDEAEDEAAGVIRKIPSFIPELDSMARLFINGQLVVVGARPGTGKSIISMNMLMRLALHDFPTAYISLELSQETFEEYLIPMYLNLAGRYAERRDVFGLKRENIRGALSGYWAMIQGEERLFTIWTYRAGVRQLRGYIRSLVRRGVRVVCIDQAEHIKEYKAGSEGRSSIHDMLVELRAMALEFGIVIVLNHQINRDGEERPQSSNLKESGIFEELADSILLLHDPLLQIWKQHSMLAYDEEKQRFRAPTAKDHQDHLHLQIPNPRQIELILAKTRDGRLGVARTSWDMSRGCMINKEGVAV